MIYVMKIEKLLKLLSDYDKTGDKTSTILFFGNRRAKNIGIIFFRPEF